MFGLFLLNNIVILIFCLRVFFNLKFILVYLSNFLLYNECFEIKVECIIKYLLEFFIKFKNIILWLLLLYIVLIFLVFVL